MLQVWDVGAPNVGAPNVYEADDDALNVGARNVYAADVDASNVYAADVNAPNDVGVEDAHAAGMDANNCDVANSDESEDDCANPWSSEYSFKMAVLDVSEPTHRDKAWTFLNVVNNHVLRGILLSVGNDSRVRYKRMLQSDRNRYKVNKLMIYAQSKTENDECWASVFVESHTQWISEPKNQSRTWFIATPAQEF